MTRRTLHAHRNGYANRTAHGRTSSPVDLRRSRSRASRYSSPACRAARVATLPPAATSWASSPTTALRVEWNDDRVDPSTHSQFQPPSTSWCSTNQATIPSTSAPNHTPLATVQALMQQSTSPPQ